jgi:hypothetical protein
MNENSNGTVVAPITLLQRGRPRWRSTQQQLSMKIERGLTPRALRASRMRKTRLR